MKLRLEAKQISGPVQEEGAKVEPMWRVWPRLLETPSNNPHMNGKYLPSANGSALLTRPPNRLDRHIKDNFSQALSLVAPEEEEEKKKRGMEASWQRPAEAKSNQ